MKVCGNYIIVKKDRVTDTTDGGIIIPDSVSKKMMPTNIGEVLSLGDSGDFDVVVGDRILYVRTAEIETEEDDVVIIPHASVIFIYG